MSTPSTSPADRTWAATVAMAAPAMPQWNTATNSRSSPIFSALVRIKKYSGVLLSPRARMIPATILYRKIKGIPAKIQPI